MLLERAKKVSTCMLAVDEYSIEQCIPAYNDHVVN